MFCDAEPKGPTTKQIVSAASCNTFIRAKTGAQDAEVRGRVL
ncbi:hypothetical protein NMG60_11003638 [Bertholletia excelsa]